MLELLFSKEKLLPGAEHKVLSAIDALQRLIREFHAAPTGSFSGLSRSVRLPRAQTPQCPDGLDQSLASDERGGRWHVRSRREGSDRNPSWYLPGALAAPGRLWRVASAGSLLHLIAVTWESRLAARIVPL